MDMQKLFENEVTYQIAKELFDSQMSVLKVKAYIVRRKQLDSGNFFDSFTEEGREYIPIEINIHKLRDEGTKEDKDSRMMTEEFEAYTRGNPKLERTDIIYWDGGLYDVRDLFTQQFNGEILYQKFRMVFIQPANDFPDLPYP